MHRSFLRQALSLAAKVAVTAVLLWYVFGKADFAVLGARLRDFYPLLVALAALVLFFQVLVAAARWSAVIRTIHAALPFGTVLQLIFVGAFFNQTLPSVIGGDAMRVWHAYRHGLPLRAAFNSVMLDRLVALTALMLVMLAGFPWLYRLVENQGIRLGVISAMVLMLAGLVVLYVARYAPAMFSRWRLTRLVQNLSRDLHTVLATPRIALRVGGLSALLHVTAGLVVYVIARSLSLPISVVDCLVLVPPVILLTILPISIAGWGVRELGMISALGYAGISSSDALLISITQGVLAILVSLPGGWFWLAKKYRQPRVELSYRDVVEQRRER